MDPRTIEYKSDEYKRLEAVAKMLEAISPNGYRYEVEDCYFDYGQEWMWTTIIAHNDADTGLLSRWQAIDPKEWDRIIIEETAFGFAKIVEDIRNRRYFSDK